MSYLQAIKKKELIGVKLLLNKATPQEDSSVQEGSSHLKNPDWYVLVFTIKQIILK